MDKRRAGWQFIALLFKGIGPLNGANRIHCACSFFSDFTVAVAILGFIVGLIVGRVQVLFQFLEHSGFDNVMLQSGSHTGTQQRWHGETSKLKGAMHARVYI